MPELKLAFEFDQREYVSGESVFFKVALSHDYETAASVPTFRPLDRALKITLVGPDGKRSADGMSCSERDGFYINDSGKPHGTSLEPGKKMELSGDLLSWFGTMKPGAYTVQARFSGIYDGASSEELKLRVLPSVPILSTVPRWGKQDKGVPSTAAWVHKRAKDYVLFYQQQSPYLPRNPWHCVSAAVVKEEVPFQAATLADSKCATGHAYWSDKRGRLNVVAVDPNKGALGDPVAAKVPFKGMPLASGLTLSDGTLLMPYADQKQSRFAVLKIDKDGKTETYELDLGKTSPIGSYVCFWERADRLHFMWAKPGGRQVEYALLPLDDLDSGFATRTVYISADPVLRLDAYLDEEIPPHVLADMYMGDDDDDEEEVEETEPPPPKVMAWCVSGKGSELACTPLLAATGGPMPPTMLRADGVASMRLVSSAAALGNGLALLLADDSGKLHYGSTMRKKVVPFAEKFAKEVGLRHQPSLMVGGKGALANWVHLRYLWDGSTIDYIRVEPENELDAVENKAATAKSTTKP